MPRIIFAVVLMGFAVGCQPSTIYEIDFSKSSSFKWDGKVRITEVDRKIRRIELGGLNSTSAAILVSNNGGRPKAKVGPSGPPIGVNKTIGSHAFWTGKTNIVLIIDPDRLMAFVRWLKEQSTEHQGWDYQIDTALAIFTSVTAAPMHRKPYAKHLEMLDVTDWWAVALQEADELTLRFRVAKEDIEITMRGDPRKYGPAVLEVRTKEGKLLKKFEQEQIAVKEIEKILKERKSPEQPNP